jgi:hypothetical protein
MPGVRAHHPALSIRKSQLFIEAGLFVALDAPRDGGIVPVTVLLAMAGLGMEPECRGIRRNA